jgi:hypothetical protein
VSATSSATIREQLRQQIEYLPDDVVEQVADFTMFLMARRQIPLRYADWKSDEWQGFALGQLFREAEDVIFP